MQSLHRQIDRSDGEPPSRTLVVEGMSCGHCELVITGEAVAA